MKGKLDEESTLLQLFQLDQSDDDLSHLFSTTQPVCQNVTLKENWMISNIKVDIPEISTICWKHREYYGSKFRIRSSKCMYPGHVKSKRKQTVKPMSLPAVLQTERLFSSAIFKIVLPLGHPGELTAWLDFIQQIGENTQSSLEMHVECAIKSIMMPLGIPRENLQRSLDILKIDIKCYAHLLKYFLFFTFQNQYYYYYYDNFETVNFTFWPFPFYQALLFFSSIVPGKTCRYNIYFMHNN